MGAIRGQGCVASRAKVQSERPSCSIAVILGSLQPGASRTGVKYDLITSEASQLPLATTGGSGRSEHELKLVLERSLLAAGL